MKEYKTLQTVHLYSGKIGLSDDQAESRAGKLKKIGRKKRITSQLTGIAYWLCVCEIVAPVQFKAGEIIRLDEIPKAMYNWFEIAKVENDAEKPA